MDTLSSSVTTLKFTPPQFHHFKIPSTAQHLPPSHFITKPHSSISKKPTPTQSISLPITTPSPPPLPSRSSSPNYTHQNPATGYAVALLDIAQRTGSLEILQKDVQRLSKLLQNQEIYSMLTNPLVGDKEKGIVVKEVGKKGRFNRVLVRFLKMLIERNRFVMVKQVLVEFQRIFDELCGTEVVLVSSRKKMGEVQLVGIA
ncbi:ATP synthase delta chain, chloroplastic [Mercurialis annua]|uniref:ATP synthase delta chain, chloroplastic n=1 Tax=Mercurialis annua TaxID=3986 RepID=UPI002160AF5D|nr:ATP synthase delta chain, chloroplastic [Mercurialis annua]